MNTLGIFVKEPVPGRVKSRLAADIGNERASELYAAFMNDIVRRFRDTGDRRSLCYTPSGESARRLFDDLAANCYEIWPQPDLSLGERLDQFFRYAFEAGASRAVVIGSDSPTLPSFLINEAFDKLRHHDCVIGPATDGGYYLIGQSGDPRPLFDDIDWSQPTVLGQTVERMRSGGVDSALLTPWYDVDCVADLQLLRGHIAAMHAAGDAIDVSSTESSLVALEGD